MSRLKEYKAIIWTSDPNKPGERVTILARDAKEAAEKLHALYGPDIVFTAHNEKDANRPR